MDWRIEFGRSAEKQFGKLDVPIQEQILAYFNERVLAEPDPRRLGRPLTGEFNGLWRYRIGGYRAICEIKDRQLTILVIAIGHRREIYD